MCKGACKGICKSKKERCKKMKDDTQSSETPKILESENVSNPEVSPQEEESEINLNKNELHNNE